jgi:lactate permease
MGSTWSQNYDPLHQVTVSTIVAALPIVLLLASIAVFRIRIHLSALIGLGAALINALVLFRMPAKSAAAAAVYGGAFGFFPIGWIILNVIFLYDITVKRGCFESLRRMLLEFVPDRRIQLLLVAFCFGAFIEGIAGFGAPVAITGAILIQLGFPPVKASVLCLIANTAPVAFGSLGIPITTLQQVTGLDLLKLSAMAGRQLPLFSLIIPFWLMAADGGWRKSLEVWPASLAAGLAFAIPQFILSNFHGPWIVDTVSGACSVAAVVILMRFWKPVTNLAVAPTLRESTATGVALTPRDRMLAAMPWVILTFFIVVWSAPRFKIAADSFFAPKIPVPWLHNVVMRSPPVSGNTPKAERAEYNLNLLSASGTAILAAALLTGFVCRFSPRELLKMYGQTFWRIRLSLVTIVAMLALGNVTRFSGADATLGLAMAQTAWLYPFFGTLLGWLGVALTGSDTASNVLFGSLQTITAHQLGLSPVLMAAANSSGGVMGKMVDAQSIVVASTATNAFGHEAAILKQVLGHSLSLASLVGLWVLLQAYVWPFKLMTLW